MYKHLGIIKQKSNKYQLNFKSTQLHSLSYLGGKQHHTNCQTLPCMNRLINDNLTLTILCVCPDILQLEPGTSGQTIHCRAEGEGTIRADRPVLEGKDLCEHSTPRPVLLALS